MDSLYNMRSPAVRRLMKEAQELSIPTVDYYAQPVEDNLFEWHFTVRGPAESDFDGGVYHGRIILPPDYPMKPPSIILLNPNGRFDINKKICLSISGHHPESWQPSWSIRTALLALIGFMPTHGGGAIGSLDYSSDERVALAKRSNSWICPACGPLNKILCERPKGIGPTSASNEAKQLASQISFKSLPQDAESPTAIQTATLSELIADARCSSDELRSSLSNSNNGNDNGVETLTSVMEQDIPIPVFSQSPALPFSTIFVWILSAAIVALLVRRFFPL